MAIAKVMCYLWDIAKKLKTPGVAATSQTKLAMGMRMTVVGFRRKMECCSGIIERKARCKRQVVLI